jgi:hypothetical protein
VSNQYLNNQFFSARESDEDKKMNISSEDKTNLLLEKRYRKSDQSRLANYNLLKQATVFRQHLEALSEKEDIKVEDIDKHLFKGFLSYASRLYKTGEISESTYTLMVTQAAESYAERLVELRIAKALGKYDIYLEKAINRWFS